MLACKKLSFITFFDENIDDLMLGRRRIRMQVVKTSQANKNKVNFRIRDKWSILPIFCGSLWKSDGLARCFKIRMTDGLADCYRSKWEKSFRSFFFNPHLIPHRFICTTFNCTHSLYSLTACKQRCVFFLCTLKIYLWAKHMKKVECRVSFTSNLKQVDPGKSRTLTTSTTFAGI